LIEFRLLISVCEAWQWIRMQNLRRVGKNAGPICLYIEVHVVLRRRRRPLVVANALVRLSIIYDVSFRSYRPLNFPLNCEVFEKGSFWVPDLQGRGYPRFRMCIFKSHALPSMGPVLVELRSASSGSRGRKKKKIDRR